MSYIIRLLEITDYMCYKNHIMSEFNEEYFISFYKNMLQHNQHIVIAEKDNNIIGSGTLLIENKLTYGGCKMAHIENILINESNRGQKIGIQIINKLIELSEIHKCYRIDLICADDLIKYYKKINFNTRDETAMSIILIHNFN